VPAGVVSCDDAPVTPAALASLHSTRFAVRSSAGFEDRPGSGAAGLLVTFLDVPAEGIGDAVAACRASLRAPHVEAYLSHRGIDARSLFVAVIVQAMVGPGRRGTFASLDPGGSPMARFEEHAEDGPRVTLVDRAALDEPFRSALALESDLGGPFDLEWAESEGRIFVLQARPAPPRVAPDPFPVDFTTSQDRATLWRWDREHNPDPLSPAQQGLVALVADPGAGGAKLRVWNGYLYAGAQSTPDAPGRIDAIASIGGDVVRSWRELVAPEIDAALLPFEAERGPTPDRLARALSCFASFYRRYLAIGRALRARLDPGGDAGYRPAMDRDRELWQLGRAAAHVSGLLDYLLDPAHPAPGSAEMIEWFTALRAHLDRWGAFAPVWDVAAPTYGEDPRPLYPVLLRMAQQDVPPRRGVDSAPAAGARTVAEEDDLYFARALRIVRRALLASGRELVAASHLDDPSDVFYLPLGAAPGGDLRAQAAAARARMALQARHVPPLSLRGEERHWPRPAGAVLSGFGVGGRTRGPVVVWRDPAHPVAPAPGAVLVVPTVLPAMTFLLSTAAALVTDHGGLLDHGAFMAREYGLPAVIGTVWATRELKDGEEVVVDGAAGKVFRL